MFCGVFFSDGDGIADLAVGVPRDGNDDYGKVPGTIH
jgi:hypothetical protein